MLKKNALNLATVIRRRLRRADFIRRVLRPVRLFVDRGALPVTQDGEPGSIEINAGGRRDFDGHTPLTTGTVGRQVQLRAGPLAPSPWLGSLPTGAQA